MRIVFLLYVDSVLILNQKCCFFSVPINTRTAETPGIFQTDNPINETAPTGKMISIIRNVFLLLADAICMLEWNEQHGSLLIGTRLYYDIMLIYIHLKRYKMCETALLPVFFGQDAGV